MDFEITAAQEEFCGTLRALLAKESTAAHVRQAQARPQGFLTELWDRCAEMGLPVLGLPAPYGMGGLVDATLAALELGRAVAPVPYLEASLLPGRLLASCPASDLRDELLARVAAGGLVGVGLAEPSEYWIGSALPKTALTAGKLTGTKALVRHPEMSEWIVSAREADTSMLYHAETDNGGVRVRPRHGLDPAPLGDVHFEGALAGPLGPLVGAAVDEARVVTAGWCCGAAASLVSMAVDYAKHRVQFDRPIGSFQVLQHRMADMEVGAQGARLLVLKAAFLADQGRLDEGVALRAWSYATNVARQNAASAHQVFGGYGFTVDYDVHLYSRRIKGLQLWLGDPVRAAQRLGQLWRSAAGIADQQGRAPCTTR